jgi:hypothetical protein
MLTRHDHSRIAATADPFTLLHDAAQAVAALRPLFRSLGASLTGVAITDLHEDGGATIVIRVRPWVAVELADALDLDDRVQVRSDTCWVRGYEGALALTDTEHRLRVVTTSGGPDTGCRMLTVSEMDAVAALYAAVSL